mgnify:CR=1 FL=1
MPNVSRHSSITPAYTGRMSTTPVPALRLPDECMEPVAAYRFIHDELMLDCTSSELLQLNELVPEWMTDPRIDGWAAIAPPLRVLPLDELSAAAGAERAELVRLPDHRGGLADQREKGLRIGPGIGGGIADDALGQRVLVARKGGSQRAQHQLARDADPKATGDQLVEHEAARRIEPAPQRSDAHLLLGGRQATQRQEFIAHPVGQPERAHLAFDAVEAPDQGLHRRRRAWCEA